MFTYKMYLFKKNLIFILNERSSAIGCLYDFSPYRLGCCIRPQAHTGRRVHNNCSCLGLSYRTWSSNTCPWLPVDCPKVCPLKIIKQQIHSRKYKLTNKVKNKNIMLAWETLNHEYHAAFSIPPPSFLMYIWRWGENSNLLSL